MNERKNLLGTLLASDQEITDEEPGEDQEQLAKQVLNEMLGT